jgi:hypothetical protein
MEACLSVCQFLLHIRRLLFLERFNIILPTTLCASLPHILPHILPLTCYYYIDDTYAYVSLRIPWGFRFHSNCNYCDNKTASNKIKARLMTGVEHNFCTENFTDSRLKAVARRSVLRNVIKACYKRTYTFLLDVLGIFNHSEDDCLSGCCAVKSGRSLPTFQRSLLPPSSGWWIPFCYIHRERYGLVFRHCLRKFWSFILLIIFSLYWYLSRWAGHVARVGGEGCIQHFIWEAWREETTRKT